MSPEPEDASTSADEIVDDRVDLHHDDNRREAAAGAVEAEEGDSPVGDAQDTPADS